MPLSQNGHAATAEAASFRQLQHDLALRIKTGKKLQQRSTLDPEEFSSHIASCLSVLHSEHAQQQNEISVEALQVLALLMPLCPEPIDQHASPACRQDIVRSCWSLWHTSSTMTFKAVAALEATLKVGQHLGEQDPALTCLLDLLAAHRLGSKRSLSCINFLLPFLSADTLQTRFPTFLLDVLAVFKHPETVPLAGKVASQYIKKLSESKPQALNSMASVLTGKLAAADPTMCTALGLYLLAPLFSAERSWHERLSKGIAAQDQISPMQRLSVQICLAETAYRTGVADRKDISTELIDQALSTNQLQVRMTALAIICRPPPFRQVYLTKADLDLLSRHFLPYLSRTAEAEERNTVCGHWKVLLDRFRATTYAAARDAKKQKQAAKDASISSEAESYLADVQSFLLLAYNTFLNHLVSVAPYREQSTSLRCLALLFGCGVIDNWYNPAFTMSTKRIQATWSFSISDAIDIPRSQHRFTRCLTSTYQDIRNTAFELLKGFPESLQPPYLKPEALQPRIEAFMRNGRESQAQTAALLLHFGARDTEAVVVKALLQAETEVEQAAGDLGLAASTCPMHGAMQCLTSSMKSGLSLTQKLQDRLLRLVDSVYRVTSPVMTNSAPEGSTAAAADHEEARALGLGLEGDDDAEDLDPGSSGSVKHKVIMSACWRAMRQAGLILERVVSLGVTQSAGNPQNLPMSDLVESVADRFHHYLLAIRHRGCFMALAGNYQTFCSTISQPPASAELQALPPKWLRQRLSDGSSTKLSFTRRSAGLPYLILAVLNSNLAKSPHLLDECIDHLHETATANTSAESNNAQVHAINTLRMMFLETKLGLAILPHAERGFILAIKCFRSSFWPTRNAALLLYSALVQRVFASSSKALGNERSLKWATRTPRGDFFRSYPSLRPALLQELDLCTRAEALNMTDGDSQSCLFAILLLLSLLATPARVHPGTFTEDPFLNCVRRCFGSRVWKVREAAGDASSGLVTPAEAGNYLSLLLAEPQKLKENELHGRLLSLVRVTESLSVSSGAAAQALATLDQAAPVCLTRSFAVQQAFCKLCMAVLSHNDCEAISLPSTKQLLESMLLDQNQQKSRSGSFTSSPDGASLLMQLSDDSASVCSALLREDMPPAVHSRALQECSQQPKLKNQSRLSSRIQQLVVSDDTTLDVKLQALLALDGSVQLSTIPGLAARCLSAPGGPLQESLMPLVAAQMDHHNPTEQTSLSQLLYATSQEDQSEAARAAVARAIEALPSVQINQTLLRTLLRLLQDDDADIRSIAEEAAKQILGYSLVMHEGLAAEKCWAALRAKMTKQEAVQEICLNLIDFRKLTDNNDVLFAVERSNLFINDQDDITEAKKLSVTDTEAVKEKTRQQVGEVVRLFEERLSQLHAERDHATSALSEFLSDPLGVSTEPVWFTAALRLQAAIEMVELDSNRSLDMILQ